jgi:hypothetical protein
MIFLRSHSKPLGLITLGLLLFSFLMPVLIVLAEDATPPTVVSTTPANNSIDVPLKSYPKIMFSEPVNPNTLAGSVNAKPIVSIQAVFDTSYQTLTIDLGEMGYQKTYTIIISGTLQDTSSNQMGSDYSFSFSTAAQPSKRPTTTINVPSNLEPGETYTITGQASGYIWQKDPDNPLELRHWNENGVDTSDSPMLHPTALYFPNGENGYKFYLVYTPYPPETDENPSLMRSNDGKSFTADGVTNPLFKYNTQPIYDQKNLADPEALKVGNTWMIFYEMEQPFESYYANLGVAFSNDGVNYAVYGGEYDPPRSMTPWPTDGNPVVHFSDALYENDGVLAEPAVMFKDDLFHMWYVSIDGGTTYAVYATASDPKGPWTKYGPVFEGLRHVDVVYDPERDLYFMLHLPGSNVGQIYLESSENPEGPWTSHPNNPIFQADVGWEGSSLYRSALVQVGTQWYLYYSANPSNWMIGLAREVPGVRKAEISTNGGVSWTQLTVNPDGTWSYPWTPPMRGVYSIQVRVTDDWMREDPKEAIANVGYPTEPENPILVVLNTSRGSFSEYTAEILKAEGFNEFQMADINALNPTFLSSFDTVILTTMTLSSPQATMMQDYVSAGGNLIAFKPASALSSYFGLTSAGTTTSEGYMKVDDTTDIGKGIVSETIQLHEVADNYNLNGASVIATLYSTANAPTPYPAVATFSVGYGKTVFFAYDLPKSIALLRQGNPANANQDIDGVGGIMPPDLFVNWLDLAKVAIPQADEQMRLLSNAIMRINYYKKPLPRLWYFPDFEKTMLIWTGDQDWGSTDTITLELEEIEARGAKMSLYLTNWESQANVQNWLSRGHEVGWHLVTSSDYTSMSNDYTTYFNQFYDVYGYYPVPTIRHHSVKWFGWVDPAKIEQANGIQMDFNYYHIGLYVGTHNGWMSGSGLPMRFVDQNGTIYDVYQVMTELGDEMQVGRQGYTPAQSVAIADALFDKSENGYYSAFAANFHPVTWNGDKRLWGIGLLDLANARGIPIWSGIQYLDFTTARERATFENIAYSSGQLSFTLNLPVEAKNLPVMIPYYHEGRPLETITLDTITKSFVTDTIKGIKYAVVVLSSVGSHDFTANYGPDIIPPEITINYPVNGTVLSADTTSVITTITTSEYADCRYSTSNPFFDYETEGTDFTLGQGTLLHSFTLTGLRMGRTYNFYYKAKDTSNNINSVSTHHTFSVELVDRTSPEWRNQGESKSFISPGDSVVLSAEGKDDYGLHQSILSTNETGNWRNITWWDTSWSYRKPIVLTDTSGSTLSNYQVRLAVNYVPSKMQSDFSDLRFTSSDEMTTIPYWIESYSASVSAIIWVRVPRILASSSTKIYMYYGNPSAASTSNGAATFEFFDDFSGDTLNSNKWTEDAVNDITHSVDNYFRFEDATKGGSGANEYWVYDGTDTGSQYQAKWTPLSQFIIEWKSQLNDLTAAEMGQGMVGIISTGNKVIGVAGHQDWKGLEFFPERGVITENSASSVGTGVTKLTPAFPYYSYKTTSTTDVTTWKIVYNGATIQFYDNDGFFAEATATSAVSKIALVAGAYGGYPFLDYIQMEKLTVRKYASSEPSSFNGLEEQYGVPYIVGWMDTSWQYRKPITITDTSGSALSNYQVNLIVNHVASKMKSDFSDIRFTSNDKTTLIPHWIESFTTDSTASIWVRVPNIPAGSTTTIYMYYGNPTATDASDGAATFEFFDYFSGSALDTNKWTVNAVNQITYQVGNYFRFKEATKSAGAYWVYDGTSTGSQHQAKWTPISKFIVEFRSTISDTAAAQMGEGLIGLIASDNTVIGVAGYHDWEVANLLPMRGITTENQASLMGTGVSKYYSGFPYTVLKSATATDSTYWKIIYDGATLKFYDSDGFFAEATITTAVSKLALAAGAYGDGGTGYTYLDYVQMNDLRVRKYASSEPSVLFGSEQPYGTLTMNYFHGSPRYMGDVAETWMWSDFTWNNPSIPEGTVVGWKIWYVDTSGNWKSTDEMTFVVYTITSAAQIESCDSLGNKKDRFTTEENVYANGINFPPFKRNYQIYIVADVATWTDGMEIPTRVSGTTALVSSDLSGKVLQTLLWRPRLALGNYDIVVDVDGDGKYTVGIDALDGLDIGAPGFFVIPEYILGTILSLGVCFAGVAVYRRFKHSKHNP